MVRLSCLCEKPGDESECLYCVADSSVHKARFRRRTSCILRLPPFKGAARASCSSSVVWSHGDDDDSRVSPSPLTPRVPRLDLT
jgi:hypothetical protein